MKKIVALVLTVFLLMSLCGCGNTSNTDVTELSKQTEQQSEQIQQDNETVRKKLYTIFSSVSETNNDCNLLMSIIYEHWDYNGWESFFDYDTFLKNDSNYNTRDNYSIGSFYGDAKLSFEYRDKISESLTTIKTDLKELSITDETQAYYDAIKELYICVDSYYSFVSEYPNGYSKMTYVQAISEHNDEFEKLVSQVEFEQ